MTFVEIAGVVAWLGLGIGAGRYWAELITKKIRRRQRHKGAIKADLMELTEAEHIAAQSAEARLRNIIRTNLVAAGMPRDNARALTTCLLDGNIVYKGEKIG